MTQGKPELGYEVRKKDIKEVLPGRCAERGESVLGKRQFQIQTQNTHTPASSVTKEVTHMF